MLGVRTSTVILWLPHPQTHADTNIHRTPQETAGPVVEYVLIISMFKALDSISSTTISHKNYNRERRKIR